MFRTHPVLSAVTIMYLGLVGWVTLGPQPLDESGRNLVYRLTMLLSRYELTDWITYDVIEFGANIAMFVPIGTLFLLLAGRRKWWLALGLGVVLTVAIELTQRLLPERFSDPRDILANSLGSLIGLLATLVLTAPAARRARLTTELDRLERENRELRLAAKR